MPDLTDQRRESLERVKKMYETQRHLADSDHLADAETDVTVLKIDCIIFMTSWCYY